MTPSTLIKRSAFFLSLLTLGLLLTIYLGCESGPSQQQSPSQDQPAEPSTGVESDSHSPSGDAPEPDPGDDHPSATTDNALDPSSPPPVEADETLQSDLEFACQQAQQIVESNPEKASTRELKQLWYKAVLDDGATSQDFRAMVTSLERLPAGDQYAEFTATMALTGGPDDWRCDPLRSIFPSRDDIRQVVDNECDEIREIIDNSPDDDTAWTTLLEAADPPTPNGVITWQLNAHRQELSHPDDRAELIDQFRTTLDREREQYSFLEPCDALEQLVDRVPTGR